MRKTLLTSAALLALSFTTFAQIPTSGLVGYWPFDGDANDYSGNNNNGTVYGATLVADRFGVANRAYSFNGTNNNIIVNNSSTISISNTGAFTFAFWIKTYSDNSYSVPVCKSAQGSFNGFEFLADNQDMGYCHSPGAFSFYTASGAQEDACANSPICDDYSNWYFITGTYDGSLNQSKLYVNAVLQSDAGQASGSLSNTSDLSFGSVLLPGNQYFSGALDGARMYNRILNGNEITALYNEGTTGIDEHLSGYSNVSLFPNPAGDVVHLSFTSQKPQTAFVKIADSMGKTVYNSSQEIMQGSNELSVKADYLPSGIYTLQLSSESGQVTRKVSIIH